MRRSEKPIPPHKRRSEKPIPPHKRRSEKPIPTPESLASPFQRNVQLRAQNVNADRSGRAVYSNNAISRWFIVGMDDGASVARLKPISVESIKRKSFILVKTKSDKENNEAKESPWSSIAENVLPDLLSSFEKARAEDSKDAKPTLQARFGKILFHHGSPSVNLESVCKDRVTEATLTKLKKTFYTSVPASYTANIVAQVAKKIGVNFVKVKNAYKVKLSDRTQPDLTISCKCRVKDDKKLQLYQVELNPVRDMIIDILCSDMDLDLRLALTHKRILTSMTEDEMQSIRNLIDSAVLDPDVKGGLIWPLGKATCGDRYSVIGNWHTLSTTYQNASIRLKVRHADRFDFKTTFGETSMEVGLKLKGILSGLLEKDVETNTISDMLKDNLSLIWQHMLQCEHFLT